ncbi:MAG: M15 family metallopeptidase [Clostridiales bacterium]|nr:M15 family metallopeptidase [Clostridiales bacterium]
MARRRVRRSARRPGIRIWTSMLLLAACLLSAGFIHMSRDGRVVESNLILVNKQRRLPAGYVPGDLRAVDVRFARYATAERHKLRDEAAGSLERMFEAATADGLRLIAVSGYRSYDSQDDIRALRGRQAGEEHASRYIADAGASEHQTGLAMDVCSEDCADLIEEFSDTDEYRWLLAHAAEYGFIIRYPEGGEAVTGYAFEPWHLRYVGDEAGAIAKSGLPLESYLAKYHPEPEFVGDWQGVGSSRSRRW